MGEFKPHGQVQLEETGEIWQKLDTVYYVLPAGGILPLDTFTLKACRWVDPGYMLMAVRNVYRNPHGSIHYFDRYVTALGDDGTRMDSPHPDFLRYQTRYPFNYRGMRPHEILDIWEGDEVVKGLPGKFVPFGWAQYEDVAFFAKKMEALRDELAVHGKAIPVEVLQQKITTAKAEAYARSMGKLKAEVDYRFDHDESYHQKLVKQLDADDFKRMRESRRSPR